MQLDTASSFLVFCVLAVVLFLLFKLLSRRRALFGGRIVQTIGEVEAVNHFLMSTRLKVHSLEVDGSQDVALELTTSGPGSLRVVPVHLTRAQAQDLARMLQQAAGGGAV